MAGPSFLSWLIASKFGDYLPYYRIEGILRREGAPVFRATLCNWAHGCSELLKPISNEIRDQILASDYVQTLERRSFSRMGTSSSWMLKLGPP